MHLKYKKSIQYSSNPKIMQWKTTSNLNVLKTAKLTKIKIKIRGH